MLPGARTCAAPPCWSGHLHLCRSAEAGPLAAAAGEVLALAGGPLREGYHRSWHGVIESLAR
ncbi:hypothetical protein [Kitasatospora sp. McL0602]|uniref:hypothetical protein n=1 Tax=Kitasatospora sp. McL0602 TaxID=3439530 RepID=UPI003F89B139